MADTLDVISLAEARRAINVAASWSTRQDDLEQIVTGISRRVDDLCGPVVNRTITSETHDGGRGFIRPKKTPVSSVTSLSEYVGTTETTLSAESNASKPTSGYLLDSESTHDVKIWRRSGNSDAIFASGRRNVVLTYVAGRAADTASVDEKFKEAVSAIVRRWWNRESGAWARGGDPFLDEGEGQVGFFRAVDPMINELLRFELKPVPVA